MTLADGDVYRYVLISFEFNGLNSECILCIEAFVVVEIMATVSSGAKCDLIEGF